MDAVKALVSRFQKLHSKLGRRLESFIRNPDDEKNVHDIRTSIRRLDSMFALLDKKSRKSNMKKIVQYREFFKSNSRVRDYDIIALRLAALSPNSGRLAADLKRRRKSESDSMLAKAKALRNVGSITSKGSNAKELEKRAAKVVQKLCKKLGENLSIALEDSSKIEELHSLRKDFKRLRYILESLDSRSARKFSRQASAALGLKLDVKLLEQIQDMLGELHDSDITLEYLKASKSVVAISLYGTESKVRDSLYANFRKRMKSAAAGYGRSA